MAGIGDRISIRLSNGSLVTATVSPMPFYDPENTRQKEADMQRQEVGV
jgi:sarcosine oxidase subunit alpha